MRRKRSDRLSSRCPYTKKIARRGARSVQRPDRSREEAAEGGNPASLSLEPGGRGREMLGIWDPDAVDGVSVSSATSLGCASVSSSSPSSSPSSPSPSPGIAELVGLMSVDVGSSVSAGADGDAVTPTPSSLSVSLDVGWGMASTVLVGVRTLDWALVGAASLDSEGSSASLVVVVDGDGIGSGEVFDSTGC